MEELRRSLAMFHVVGDIRASVLPMFARLQTFRQSAEKLDKLTILVREQLTATPQPPGFKGFHYLIDRDNEKALLISFWETEEDLRRLEANNIATREHVKAEAGVDPPIAEIFEVALQAF